MAEKKKRQRKIQPAELTVAEFERMVRRWAGNRAALVLSIGPSADITIAVTTSAGTAMSMAPSLLSVYEAINSAMIEAAVDAAITGEDFGGGIIQ